jgi:putative ABC transport system ATP-binding protein
LRARLLLSTAEEEMKMLDIVRFQQVTKTYKMGELEAPVLRGVDLNVKKGAFHAIWGPSGCGKTTLLNMLGALDVPTSGEILVEDRDIAQFDEVERTRYRQQKVGFIFQFFNLMPLLTALENVELGVEVTGLSAQVVRERSEQVLSQVGLADAMHKFPAQLSGGQQQRVAIARALAKRPAIVLCDEPTGNLDNRTSSAVLDLMLELNSSLGSTFIVVTHSTELARSASHVTEMLDGRVVSSREDGAPRVSASGSREEPQSGPVAAERARALG